MTPQHITRLLERTPFVPFRLHLTNGQTFEVKHPDFVWVFRSRLELAVPAPEDARIERCQVLQPRGQTSRFWGA